MSLVSCDTPTNRLLWLPNTAVEPILFRIGLAMVLSLAVTVPALFLDDRTFQGQNVWIKPIKFQIALAIYFLTLSVYAGMLPHRVIASVRMRVFLIVASLAAIGEMLWIGGAAMFATASHYNTGPVMSIFYGAMGVAAIILTSVSLVLGLAFWKADRGVAKDPLYLSLALGLILTFVLTVPIAGVLSSLPGHHIGVPITGEALPLMGWSREVGDLRVGHFFATHALHAVPLVGVMVARMANRSLGNRLVWASAVAYAASTLGTFLQALWAQPFIS
jgi:hypothetical protein